ncbi:MAE_28990/MAE_18760 family HEPN-like nuclease [Wielerella bovis]|uniref:MAE_28990/MAE_18760 family HEPN-like nuclease n=1 Tax=Wielerella bovis TaxID=2917790 RepID=UPI0020188CAD|nr:MAE_28990/MAE_18760 family HEPN-like nuclease [Wielerella bovis]MCG7657154.1 MAE_28990/MAE_18760 family HEPN-like nuclease [Wielerella bovis]MCG7659377.1 MAE_28990/MAE_18760 family HEPN-like nuclease [Wielerella bovis]
MSTYNWQELPTVSSIFTDKVEEIQRHFELLTKLLSRKARLEYGDTSTSQSYDLHLHKEDTHPLKAGMVLMLYNFVESTSTALMQDVYAHIQQNIECEPLEKLHKNLRETIINHAEINNLFKEHMNNYRHFSHNLDNLIISVGLTKLLEEKTETNSDDGQSYPKWFNGNVDFRQIKTCLQAYSLVNQGFENVPKRINDNPLSPPHSMLQTKTGRNRLAHGGVTFTEFGRKKSLEEIKTDFDNILGLFEKLLDYINQQLQNKVYLIN